MSSFDGDGLVIDRLADIKTDIQDALKLAFGNGIDLDERSPFGVVIGILSERYFLIWELLEAVYQASFPNLSYGIYLDELVAFNGITRDVGTKSSVNLTFTRSNGISDGDVTIPSGTQVVNPNNASVVWETTATGTILNGSNTGGVSAQTTEVGSFGALSGSLTSMLSVPANVLSVTNPLDAAEGRARETDSQLKLRRINQLGGEGSATESGIRSALINMVEVLNAAVVLNDTGSVDSAGRPSHSFEAYVVLESGYSLGQVGTVTADADLVTGNSIFISVNSTAIASPISFATDHATTMQLIADAIASVDDVVRATVNGNVITVQSATSAALTVTVTVTGGASQASLAFAAGTTENDVIDDIGQVIWDSKAAGIQTYGEFAAAVLDSEGNPQTVYFSDIDEVQVYVRYTFTTTSEYNSATAEPAIKQALIDYATASIAPGDDVLNYKVLCVASDQNPAGVTDITVEFSTVGSGGPWSGGNVSITPSEFAKIESNNIIFA